MSQWLPWRRRRSPEPAPGPGAGRTPSFEALYEDRFTYVCHFLRRLGVPERQIEDVAQEVFIIVHRRLPTYDPTRPFQPWLCGVAFRAARNHQRLARYRHEVLMNDDHAQVNETPDPEQLTGAAQRHNLVHLLMQTIDIDRRAVLVMHDLDGMPMGDIASALGIPMGTGYERLKTARQQMKAAAARHAARERRTAGMGAVFPVPFDFAAFLDADRQIPDVAPGVRERVWSQIQDSLGPDGPGAMGGAGASSPVAPSTIVQLASKAAPWVGTFVLGAVVGAAGLDALRSNPDDGSKVHATMAHDAPVIVASVEGTSSAAAAFAPPTLPAPPSATATSHAARATADTADEIELIRQARMAYAHGNLEGAHDALDLHARKYPAGHMRTDRENQRAQVRDRERAAGSSSSSIPSASATTNPK